MILEDKLSLSIINLVLKDSSYQADYDSVKIISKRLIFFELKTFYALNLPLLALFYNEFY